MGDDPHEEVFKLTQNVSPQPTATLKGIARSSRAVQHADLDIFAAESLTWARVPIQTAYLAVLLYVLWTYLKPPNDDRAGGGEKPKPKSPCNHKMGGRNLIVCIDGTANQFGKKNTNVVELYNRILKDANQQTWYTSGIGTYARPSWTSLSFYKQVLYHKIDLAIAWNFERTVLAAYRWLSDNYQDGDTIFLFGFSRGAFQVRVLSAMIDKVGLIHKGNETQIPFAYELYADPSSDELTVSGESPQENGSQHKSKIISMAEHFKRTFSHEVTVHFVGVWDTVSSIGIAREQKMLPRTVNGMTHVCYFRHALALDERRVKFQPEYAYGGTAISERDRASAGNPLSLEKDSAPAAGNEANLLQVRKESAEKPPHTIEVWFAGTHSDIGGGNVENVGMDRSTPPLRWMVFEAGKVGLRTEPFNHELSADQLIEIEESLTWFWWPLELIPFKRLTFTGGRDGGGTTRWPHLGSSREIHPGQKIHNSLLLAGAKDHADNYTPKARPSRHEGSFWQEIRSGKCGEWLEIDTYKYAGDVIKKFIDTGGDAATLWPLCQIATGGDGRQAVYKNVIEALTGYTNPSTEIKHQLLSLAVEIIGKKDRHLKLEKSKKVRLLVLDLWKSGEEAYQKTAREFMGWFTDPFLLVFRGHTGCVRSVIFSSDAKWIVSGSSDATIRVWDVVTKKVVGQPLLGHTGEVWSVALSSDSKRIVSGSSDKTIRIWDAETGKEVGEPLQGHTGEVWSVALSSDSKRIVSGSSDKTIRIWDVEKGEAVGEPLRGHTDIVMSVAFSSDDKHVVSGSGDKTVRIWGVETGSPVGEPLEGHTDSVESVAFSSDDKRIVSGSTDKTVRVWDRAIRKLVGKPLQGHTDVVWSVAFSSDHKRILSSSQDKTVRVWDAEGGNLVREPLRGHTDGIQSVAFSSDGKSIVSGSEDGTVRIWDAEGL